MFDDHKDTNTLFVTGEGSTEAGNIEAQQISSVMNIPHNLASNLMGKIANQSNLRTAFKAVKRNKGAPGTDKRTIKDVEVNLDIILENLEADLQYGKYKPSPVKGVVIPKPDGNERLLGIPTVVDRIVQQAISQIMSPLFETYFSPQSYGFRPKRSAQGAIKVASGFVENGYDIVVDIDIEKFFDNVNHDILMSKLALYIDDKPLLRLIRRFLQAGMMQNGLYSKRNIGTPQGSPLSPLLSNILLHELDVELSARGHSYLRYADDCNIYVQSKRAGERVLTSITRFLLRKLRLKVNQTKSAVDKVAKRKFLGFTLNHFGEISISKDALTRIKNKIRVITSRNRGISITQVIKELNQAIRGWFHYFKCTNFHSVMKSLDCWIRRRLRCFRLKQRKRKYAIKTFLTKLGVSQKQSWRLACSEKGWWAKSFNPIIHKALNLKWFKGMGLFSLLEEFVKYKSKTAVCDIACTVV
jgi:group II intron reverse transcriptase/maturase